MSTRVDVYFQTKSMVRKLVKIKKPLPASQAAWKNYLLGSVCHLRFCSKVSAAHIFTLLKSWPSILVEVSNQIIHTHRIFSLHSVSGLGPKSTSKCPFKPKQSCQDMFPSPQKDTLSSGDPYLRSKHQGWGGHRIACKWWCIMHAVAFSSHTSEELSQLGPDGASWL